MPRLFGQPIVMDRCVVGYRRFQPDFTGRSVVGEFALALQRTKEQKTHGTTTELTSWCGTPSCLSIDGFLLTSYAGFLVSLVHPYYSTFFRVWEDPRKAFTFRAISCMGVNVDV